MNKLLIPRYLLRECAVGESGFMILTTVMLAGAVAVSIAASMVLMGILATQSSFSSEQSQKANGLAGYCAETALKALYNNPAFTTAGTNLSIDTHSCDYVVSGSGQTRTITSSGTVGSIEKRIQIDVTQITPVITYSNWNELP
jgi:hypothetical protein